MTKNSTFKVGIVFILLLSFYSKSMLSETIIRTDGSWHGQLKLNDSIELPIKFYIHKVNNNYLIDIINGAERIHVDEIYLKSDSIFIKMPVFDSEFRCKILNDHELKGYWINYSRKDKNKIPFYAFFVYKEAIRICPNKDFFNNASPSLNSTFETTFSPNSKQATKAIGIFKHHANDGNMEGTFLTETGDYRYLTGKTTCDVVKFSLSTFDGSHAFVFTGQIKGDSIVNGHFYSGTHWHESWIAVRNEKFQLRNPDSLTYLKPGVGKMDFSFKNLEGKTISLSDEKFKNKVVIIQIMGSWCPNCLDETAFLAPLYDKNKSKGLEIVALAFERTPDFLKSATNINRLKKRYNANYEFLITQKTGSDEASAALPMLNGIMAFPTTIYIDRKGVVRKIYTGFNGPATGAYYTHDIEQTNLFLEKLLKE